MASTLLTPDYLFEVSWEVCNKVGGIHTVLSTKAKTLADQYKDRYILIGPDILRGAHNPEFAEDTALLKSWREHATNEGLKIKLGRWNISSSPIVILVDFSPFFMQKNEIFTDFWMSYKLDSLTGGWDYIEPALFGYATAKVIESFYTHHLNRDDKIIAQFHEWLTGAGVLYLKQKVPQVATVFTAHATVLGRAIAGSGVPFYSHFDSFIPDKAIHDFMVVSKHSLEKATALNADCFTTVSEVTARECVKFLDTAPDIITHNGFDTSIVPDEPDFENKRKKARDKLISVAEGLFNQQIPPDTVLVIKSGRYEYKNKGIDTFIDGLGELRKKTGLNKSVLGFIFVPANQTGPRKEVLDRMKNPDYLDPKFDELLTHNLQGIENDSIVNEVRRLKLHNVTGDKVKVIFAPVYLNGNDGIFDMHYYDLLIGFDLAVFPSYYEPWGYTPLESIAYHIPSVTTSLAGFGTIVIDNYKSSRPGISVVVRTDTNEKDTIAEIADIILEFTLKSETEIEEARKDAYAASLDFQWTKLISQYEKAYDIALGKSSKREVFFPHKPQAEPIIITEPITTNVPYWRNVFVEAEFPTILKALQKLIKNVWWSWDYEACNLFRMIDPILWEECNHNPVLMTRKLSFIKIESLSNNKAFVKTLDNVEKKFDRYMDVPFTGPHTAYFSMEYGICSFIKLYSGGLGVLAGDYLKEASDHGVHLTAVGLLYKKGYFRQNFSVHGEQLAEPDTQDFTTLPLELIRNNDDSALTINLFLPGRTVTVQIWKLNVGRVALYLLDTDLAQNAKEDREITSFLYGGNQEMRLKQEILLGIGGIRALNAMDIHPDVYHCNEGHAAFISIERMQNLIKDANLSFEEAREVVRASTLFTTHTSVPAANDMFPEDLLRKYLADKAHLFNIDWNMFMGQGRVNTNDSNEKFSMTYFGAKMSQEINAVSKIHKYVSRDLLSPIWKNYKQGELHVNSVTNGVHYPTWAAEEWQKFFEKELGITPENITDLKAWEKLKNIPPAELWRIHTTLKKRLIDSIKENVFKTVSLKRSDGGTFNAIGHLNENALIVGFARRFVTYKRSGLLFTDLERLSKIISGPRPVIFIFSGKAHPMDQQSINLISQLINFSANPAYKKSIIFLNDYDMDTARLLVQGVDVWLNTPERHTEASGTSGMKAAMNGVLNFSVLDGWWAEAYNGSNGWKLSEHAVYSDHELQNQLDAETIYDTLENEILPLFFERDKENIPFKWVEKMKETLITIGPEFNMQRALVEYQTNYYKPLSERIAKLKADNFAIARNIVCWKKKILSYWNEVDVISMATPQQDKYKALLGEKIPIKMVLDIGRLSPDDVGADIIISGNSLDDGCFVKEFSVTNRKGTEATYECTIRMERTGTFEYAFRIYPKNQYLPYKQDFDLITWV